MNNIVIVGGGFAGLWAALAAARQNILHQGDIRISLVSVEPYLTLRPRLYESSPQDLRVPLNPTLDPVNVSLMEGFVTQIDTAAHTITFDQPDGQCLTRSYDRLILTAGSIQKTLPLPNASDFTWSIDDHAAAVAFDDHLQQIAKARKSPGDDAIVIIGGGFTGIELATEMRSRLADHGDQDFAKQIRIVLIEQSEVIGPDLGENPRPDIEHALQSQNIDVLTGTQVVEVSDTHVMLRTGERIATASVCVTAGLRANPLAAALALETDPLGRLFVDDTLHVSGVADVFAAGDIARALVDDSNVALMSCQHAMPMGRFAGYNAANEILGLPLRAYQQPNYVTCLDLGESGAVFTTGWSRQVALRGDEAKQKKRLINCQWIYPPRANRQDILEMANIDYSRNSNKINN